jgi:hypothetical protein
MGAIGTAIQAAITGGIDKLVGLGGDMLNACGGFGSAIGEAFKTFIS